MLKNFKMPCCAALGLYVVLSSCHSRTQTVSLEPEKQSEIRTVRGFMQTRPGGPLEEAEVGVHPVPTDLPLVSAEEAKLEDTDLILGVIADGQPVAFPVRYLALYEVVNSRVGKLPVAPTW